MNDLELRRPRADECAALSDLCFRSKAHWGYDEEFIASCRDELTVTPEILNQRYCLLASDEEPLGYVEVSTDDAQCYLEKLFVDPKVMGRGVGRALLDAAIVFAQSAGAKEMVIEADPDAAPFYRKMGADDAGEVPSGSIAGRFLPRLVLRLRD